MKTSHMKEDNFFIQYFLLLFCPFQCSFVIVHLVLTKVNDEEEIKMFLSSFIYFCCLLFLFCPFCNPFPLIPTLLTTSFLRFRISPPTEPFISLIINFYLRDDCLIKCMEMVQVGDYYSMKKICLNHATGDSSRSSNIQFLLLTNSLRIVVVSYGKENLGACD